MASAASSGRCAARARAVMMAANLGQAAAVAAVPVAATSGARRRHQRCPQLPGPSQPGPCNDGYRPIHRLTVVVVQVRQQLDYGPPANTGGGYGFDADVALSPQQLIVADKPSKLSMTAHLSLPGVANHHLAWPYLF
jgi:hypothetical protein